MPRTRPAPLSRELPDAGTMRRRARAGMCVVAALLVVPFAVGGLAQGSWSGPVAGLVVCSFGFLYDEVFQERPPARHSATRITARTLTGVRSVDLDHITSVRLWTTCSYGVLCRTVLVRDVHGVRLGVTSTAGRRALRRALKRRMADGTERPPRVSRAASAYLRNGPRRHLAVHTVLVFFAELGFIIVYLSALFATAAM
ncbi:hypothetical protein OG800_24185 [Streptomyces sp. NBC_00445]|uniref:hypothetical protein n=1 Tax=Streptomyces sp. NBC_00445 TaxID=2975745 RepID=UPI002E1F5149